MSSSASRKVARAAAAGRNSRARREVPLGFYSLLAILVILGTLVVGYSRYEKQHPLGTSGTPPTIGAKWTAAIGFNDCGTYLSNLPAQSVGANQGIYSLANGIIEVSPKVASATGAHATLAKFVSGYKGLTITSKGFTVPGHAAVSASSGCGGKAATFGIYSWSSLLATTPTKVTTASALKFANGQLIEVAVLAKGQSPSQPPSKINLVNSTTTTTTAATTTTLATTATTSASTTSTTKAKG